MRYHFGYFIAAAWMVSIPCLYAAYDSSSASIQQSLQSQRLGNSQQQPLTMQKEQPQQALSASDQSLKSRIEDKLESFPWNTKNIEVEVKNGKVTLRGSVDNYEQQQMVEEKLQDLQGITLINNQLEIQSTNAPNRWNSRDVSR